MKVPQMNFSAWVNSFDTQHVEICSNMAEIAKIACKLCEKCMKVCKGASESVWNSKYIMPC